MAALPGTVILRVARWRPVAAWLITRAGLVVLLLTVEQVALGDVNYYYERLHRHLAEGVPAAQTMPEYPTPVLWLLMVPWVLSGQSAFGFRAAFISLMVVLDAAFTVLLWNSGRGRLATLFWIGFVASLGPITYLRLDLIPAVAVGGAVIALLNGAERLAGGLLAVGGGLKLWPGLLYPTTFNGRRLRDHRVTVGFGLTGLVLVAAAWVYGGWARLVSPLQWQSGRGLQIESLWATPPMLARLFDPAAFPVQYSAWQAYEIFGPGVDGWLRIATWASVLGYLLVAVGWLVWFARRYPQALRPRPRLTDAGEPAGIASIALFMTAVVAIVVITNKTFSPQYLIWLGAAVAALLLATDAGDGHRRQARIAAWWLLGLALATHVVYPLAYGELVAVSGWTPLVTVVLAMRNLGVLVLGIWLIGRWWHQAVHPQLSGSVSANL